MIAVVTRRRVRALIEGSDARGHVLGAPSVLRLMCMTAFGAVVSVCTAFVAPWQLALLTGWITAAITFLVIVWWVIATADGERTRRFATVQDDSRAVASLVVIGACTASLAGAGFALHKASQTAGAEAALLTVVSVAVVVVSWLVVNTEFTLRYAHRYFSASVSALDEIHIAWRVAKAHWQGPRSEATRFKFELESEIISSLRTITAGWERYMGDLAAKQREAQKADEELFHALAVEVGVEVIALTPWGRVGQAFRVVFSAARSSKVVRLSSKLRWAFDAAARLGSDLHKVLSGHAQWLRGQGKVRAFALRAEVESLKELAKVSVTNVWNGNAPLKRDDWWNIFVASGLAGSAGSVGIGEIAKKYGVTNAVERYGAEDAADVAGKTAAKSATEAALAAPFASGVAAAAAKPAAKRAIMEYLAKLERLGVIKPGKISESTVENVLTVGQKATEKAGEEVPNRVGEEQDLPSPPPGEFPQRPRN